MKYFQFFQKKVIQRTKDVPYLIRWNIFGIGKDSSFFSIKVHNILISDDACMHDHPWAFLSIILKGGYVETAHIEHIKYPMNSSWKALQFDEKSRMWTVTRKFGAGAILYRPANWSHKLEIDPEKTAWTLVFTFRKIKKWGFFTPKGWLPWNKYSKEKDC